MPVMILQVEVSAQHGFVTLTQEHNGLASGVVSESQTSVSGTSWQVNTALRSMEYVSAADWHGWDKISIIVTDLGYDGIQPNTASVTYYLHVSVAAVNDAPVLEAAGFDSIAIIDEESPSGEETEFFFLVPAQEDTVAVIAGVTVSDVDTEAEGLFLNRPDGFFATLSTDGAGNGAELLAVEPKIALSLSCAYGLLGLGAAHGGLVAEEGDLDGGGNVLSVTGKLSNINAALAEGIIYTPSADWNGIDVVEVRLPASIPKYVDAMSVSYKPCFWLVLPGGTVHGRSFKCVVTSMMRKTGSSIISNAHFCQSLSPQVTVDDRGNGGKTLQGIDGSLSSTILLAMDVAPVNDAPTLTVPTADEVSSSAALLTAEEDRLGIVGAGYFGWSDENILGSTTISNASIVLADADVAYATGATTPEQPYSRWKIETSAVDSASEVNDTMTVTVTVSHGGILLSDARSEVTLLVLSPAAATSTFSSEFAAELELSGPMWAVAGALKGVLYRTDLNWNSWVGSGGSQLQPVVPEVGRQRVTAVTLVRFHMFVLTIPSVTRPNPRQ